ncbi:MAG: DUF58 domain-containing protein, partial [Anaerolineae bacterium]|nr:DUF58 domain-containing protein [Anaerolineae bacterium]
MLVGLLLVMMLTYTHESWIIAFFVLAGMWLVSYLWAMKLAEGLRLHRQMRFGWARVGDRLEEQFTLTNNGMAPVLWVEVLDHSTLPNYQASQVRAVGNYSQIRWETEGVCSRRGIFSLGPTTLRTSDPFNLYVVKLHYPQSVTLTVTPPIVPLPTIKVATGGRSGDERPRPKALERTETTTSVRGYVPGDDLRAIHWRTSARRGQLFVRDFQHTPAGDWWIILDLEAGVQVGDGENSTEEYAITLAASLTDRGLRAGRAVGLMAYGQDLGGPEAGLVRFRPQPGDAQRHQILQALATINPGTTPLAELLSQTRLGHLGSIIVITPNVNSQWIEMLLSRRRPETAFTVLLFD